MIAADSNNIVVIAHARKRKAQRSITRLQIERCVRLGAITEGPFINGHGNWQMNLTRQTAEEQITCAVAIEWATRIIVTTTF
jgi:lactam utilization protein B